jgi:hypothetical protein
MAASEYPAEDLLELCVGDLESLEIDFFQRQFYVAVVKNQLHVLQNIVYEYPDGVVDLQSGKYFVDEQQCEDAFDFVIKNDYQGAFSILLGSRQIDLVKNDFSYLRTCVAHNRVECVRMVFGR